MKVDTEGVSEQADTWYSWFRHKIKPLYCLEQEEQWITVFFH